MAEYLIPVPGRFAENVAMVDVETWKVPTPAGYRMPNGEVLKKRWAVCLAGVARDGMITIVDPEGDELAGLADVSVLLAGSDRVVYGATREFDQMILSGRFTNARRAHLPEPTWPAVDGAEELPWENVGISHHYERGPDVQSRGVSETLKRGEWEPVFVHLLRDVCELILSSASPGPKCRRWCEQVLVDYDFAAGLFYE